MKKRNITLTLSLKIMEIIDNLYEEGLVKSRTDVVEMALFDWIIAHKLIKCQKGKYPLSQIYSYDGRSAYAGSGGLQNSHRDGRVVIQKQ